MFLFTRSARRDTWNLIHRLLKLTTPKETWIQRSNEVKMVETLIPSVMNLGTCRFKYSTCKVDLLIQTNIQIPTKPYVPKKVICELLTPSYNEVLIKLHPLSWNKILHFHFLCSPCNWKTFELSKFNKNLTSVFLVGTLTQGGRLVALFRGDVFPDPVSVSFDLNVNEQAVKSLWNICIYF